MDETQEHLDAFELYHTLIHSGNNKTQAIIEVAKQLEYSETAIWGWKRKLHWDEKEAIRSKEIQKEVEKQTDSTIIDNKVSYLSMIHDIFQKYIDDVEDEAREPLELNSTVDLVRLIYVALKIQGEDSNDKPIKVEVEGSNESQIPPEVIEAVGDLIIYSKGAGNDRGKCESASTERDSKA